MGGSGGVCASHKRSQSGRMRSLAKKLTPFETPAAPWTPDIQDNLMFLDKSGI